MAAGPARRGGGGFFIGVVAVAFSVVVSVMALGFGRQGQPAAADSRPAAGAETSRGETAGAETAGTTAWIRQLWSHRAAGQVAAARHAEHLMQLAHQAHMRHLAHLAYLRRLAAYRADGEAATVADTTTAYAPYPEAGTRAQAVDWALRQAGVPYLWGGTGNGGFDCSGLVMSAWAVAGVQLPRTSYEQADAGTRIGRSQLRPGDLVFSNGFGHVAMYIGGGRVIQAPEPGEVVSVAALPPDAAVDAYVRVPAADGQARRVRGAPPHVRDDRGRQAGWDGHRARGHQPATSRLITKLIINQPVRATPAAAIRAGTRAYTVRPGDTLSSIAQRLGGPSAGWAWLYQANRSRIADPNLIYPGQVLTISPAAATSASQGASARPDGLTLGGTLGCAGLEALWERAGGSPSGAVTAASVAMAESSGQQYATGPVGERGYWQINPVNGWLSTYDPYGNARAAVILSADGASWAPWTTYTSGAYAGRC